MILGPLLPMAKHPESALHWIAVEIAVILKDAALPDLLVCLSWFPDLSVN
jgi:hypothetical protein